MLRTCWLIACGVTWYGTPDELTEAAALCEDSAARLANECAPRHLAELKQQLRGKGVPRCKLP